MVVTIFNRLGKMVPVLLMQILVLNHIHLFGYATPIVSTLFLLSIPLNANRISTMLYAFVMGIILDAFTNTPGVSAGALTLTAFVQQSLLSALVPKDTPEDFVPTFRKLGKWKFFWYIVILTATHHTMFFLLESFSFFNILDQLLSLVTSFLLSLVLILPLARR